MGPLLGDVLGFVQVLFGLFPAALHCAQPSSVEQAAWQVILLAGLAQAMHGSVAVPLGGLQCLVGQ